MATLRERAAAVKADMHAIVDRAKAESRDLFTYEAADIEAKADDYNGLIDQAEASEKAQATTAGLAASTPEPEAVKGEPVGGSLASRFVKSEPFQGFRKTHPTGIGAGTPLRVEVKGVGSVRELGIGKKADITTETGQWVGYGREEGYRNNLPVDEPLTFLELITVGSTDVAYSEYAAVVAETNNAAIVPEGELKPLSDLSTDTFDSKAYTYADGFVVTNQTLADDGALVAFMESRIKQHVRGVSEQQLFNGAGGATETTGILNPSGTLDQASDEDAVVTISRALEKFTTANGNASPQAIVMNPADVWNLRLLKDANGNYLLGNPLQQGPIPTPWGVPLVASNKLDAGTALVGRFDSVHYLELEPLSVLAFNQHEDFAQRNKAYVRAESRGRQLFYAPREVVVATIADEG